MTLEDLKVAAGNLAAMPHADRIKLFGWWLHVHKGKAHFQATEIGKCYDELHIGRPTSFGGYFANLEGKDLLKNASGYRLAATAREMLDAKYAQHKHTIAVTNLLQDLPTQLPTLAERTYLDEALTCYRHGAFRAAIVMTWNLAYAHLCDHVIKNRLADFNARWQLKYPGMHKNSVKTVASIDDFNDDDLKEHQVLGICKDAGIVGRGVYNVMEPTLKKRNASAHPNTMNIGQMQADAFISDLITNAVLKI